MIEIKTYNTKDLVLEISKSYDPTRLNLQSGIDSLMSSAETGSISVKL